MSVNAGRCRARRILLVGASIAPLLAGVEVSRAQNSTGAPPAATVLEEIIVTSQRKSESLQSVPLAVSAYTSERRESIGIVNTQDIANFTPGLSYQNYPNRIFLRGVGRNTNTVGNDPGIATYYDGFYTGETGVIAQPTFFVDRVEILRGPQGTLYGRNSIGGAVNVVSRRPTDEFASRIRMTAGNYEHYELQADASGPITDSLRFRVVGSHVNQGEGYVRNHSGEDLYKLDQTFLEAQLAGDITDSFSFWLKGNYAQYDNTATWAYSISPYATTSLAGGLYPNPQFGLETQNPATRDIHEVDVDYAGHVRLRGYKTVVAEATLKLGFGAIKYVGGFNEFDHLIDIDFDQTSRRSYSIDGLPISSTIIQEIRDQKESSSHELTLASPGGDKVDWIVGLYYWKESENQPYTRYDPNNGALSSVLYDAGADGLLPAAPNPRRAYVTNDTNMDLTATAAFGQLEYALNEQWNVTLGARYSRDRKTGFESLRLVMYNPFIPFLGNERSLELVGPDSGFSQRTLQDEWSGWTGRLALDWQPDPDTLYYGSVSTGYKAGGFNLGNLAAPPFERVGEEKILAYELGVKKTLAGELRVNTAAFYYDYTDLQLVRSVAVGPTFEDGFVNAPQSRSYGVEIEADYTPVEGLELLLSYSYLDAQIEELCCLPNLSVPLPPSGVPLEEDLSGRKMVLAPDNKVAFNANYTWPWSVGALTLSTTYTWIDAQFGSIFNEPASRIPSHSNVDLRAIWNSMSGRYRVTGFVRNLLDEDSYNSVSVGDATTDFAVTMSPNEPRTFGVELELTF